jgi:hypothetical protein
MSEYYVYAYIDPRNLEEFYYGKGKGSRKEAHLSDLSDSLKAKRIAAIKREGLSPIIRVLARNLTERDALLVEKTLIWKLGKQTENIATGAFADNFRPHDTLHKELSGFDYRNGLYYYNVGEEGGHRNWDDYLALGFISAGQGVRWRDAMLGFKPGDIFAAYLQGHGFVGIGRITAPAVMVRDVQIGGVPLLDHHLYCQGLAENKNDPDFSEYVCTVKWLSTVSRDDAKWKKKAGLYTTQHVRASLDGQPETISFLEEAFEVSMRNAAA